MNLSGALVRPSWWAAWLGLVVRTGRDPLFVRWLLEHRVSHPADVEVLLSPPERGGLLSYRYDGQLAPFWEALRRGYAACAEVAAYTAAAAIAMGWQGLVAIGEGAPEGGTGYSHLRMAIGGVIVDPYEQEARVGEGQTIDWLASLDGVIPPGVVVLDEAMPLDAWRGL